MHRRRKAILLRTPPAVAAGGTDLPALQTVAFGAKTRKGYGGHNLAYTGSGTLSISAGNTGTVWAIDNRNHLVPAIGGGAYGDAAPSFSGPYSLTVTDGNSTSTVTVNITTGAAGAAHWREMTTTPGGTNQDNGARDQIYHMLLDSTATGALSGGDHFVGRDGHWNPDMLTGEWFEPPAANPFWGGGRVTVRSENPYTDSDIDAQGLIRQGGRCRIGGLYLVTRSSGDIDWPIDFQHIDFYFAGPVGVETALVTLYLLEGKYGLGWYNCRAEIAATTDMSVQKTGGFYLGKSATVQDCRFHNLVGNLVSSQVQDAVVATSYTLTRNSYTACRSDCLIGAGVGFDVSFHFAKDFQGDLGFHPDMFQHLGFTDGADHPGFGSYYKCINVRHNTLVDNDDGQGAFWSDNANGSTCSGASAYNNINHLTQFNSLYAHRFNGITYRYNTCLCDIDSGYTFGISGSAISADGGTDATVERNIANQCNLIDDFTSQAGTITGMSTNIEIASSSAAYLVCFPNYTRNISTRAEAIVAFTPARLAKASGGAKLTDGTYAGALFPVDDHGVTAWNDGTVFVPSDTHIQAV